MNPSVAGIIAVGAGGAIGAIMRYLINVLFVQRFGPGFPWGTLFINVTGSFLIGVVIQLEVSRALGVTPLVRLFLAVGVLGGYTTFSSFSFEVLTLAGEHALASAFAYAAGSVLLGLAAAYAGIVTARLASP